MMWHNRRPMQEGRASQTAVMVCSARALAHLEGKVPGFSDPTALALLPEDARARFEQVRAGQPVTSARKRFAQKFLQGRSHMMAVRTVAIDQAVRESAPSQVVIMGAGLDGRAWRMPELRDALVFEVDHPDTQRDKLERLERLDIKTGHITFVAADFGDDGLGAIVTGAGFRPDVPALFLCEGVAIYLERPVLESLLRELRGIATDGSLLAISLSVTSSSAAESVRRQAFRTAVAAMGEPARTVLRPDELDSLLSTTGWTLRTTQSERARLAGLLVLEPTSL